MKRLILYSIAALVLAFALPLMFLAAKGGEKAAPPVQGTSAPTAVREEPQTVSVFDEDISFSLLTDSGGKTVTMAEYLPLALAGEMPAAFDDEALKAQAVALRSYVLCSIENGKGAHEEDICTSPGCCMAMADEQSLREMWGTRFDDYFAKICLAVNDTDGQYLVYEDKAILAVFHASSYVCTEDGQNLWSYRPYLISVPSPETNDSVSNLRSVVEVSAEDFKSTVLGLYPDASLGGAPETWLGGIEPNSTGRVAAVTVGGARVSGSAMRSMFSLRSTSFTLSWTGECFLFEVEGYGHGVGMSQYGANLLAKQGENYAEILEHYYPGTELVVSVRISTVE